MVKMNARGKSVLVTTLLALTGLMGCTPATLETTPVTVETEKGAVVCQLYTREILDWDRAIRTPAGMTPDQADQVCRTEGVKQQHAIKG